MNNIIKPETDELFKDYCHRISSQKELLGYSWQDIADNINSYYDVNLSAAACRKREARYNAAEAASNIDKYKFADQRTQINALQRRISREDTIKDIAREYAESITKIDKFPAYQKVFSNTNTEKDSVLLISDWHYGIEENSTFNTYNPKICKERVITLRNKVFDIIEKENLTHLNILNLGDMVAGRIHLPLRLASRIDVITQIMDVSEIIAQFIYELSTKVAEIDYYSTLDNHSRIEPAIKDSLDLESLYRITDWYLKERFKDFKNIKFHDNEFGDDILTFDMLTYRVAAVHGHKDKPDKIIDNLTLFTKKHYDMICSAHFHHFSCDEKNETILVSNSSLMGTDDYARSLRLNSKPSQIMIISTLENVCECIYKILL